MGMHRKLICVISFLFFLTFSPAIGAAADEVACANLAATVQANIGNFELGPGLLTISGSITGSGTSRICQVNLTQYHAINIRLGLPINATDGAAYGIANQWNGKVQHQGGGGFVGSVGSVNGAGTSKYVYSSTDSGHGNTWCNTYNPETGQNNSLNNCGQSGAGFVIDPLNNLIPWQVTDFITDSLYAQVRWALDLTEMYYGRKPDRNYWNGCSTGGRQGWELAQKYGDLFDGIVAGAPAMNWNRFQTAELWPPVVVKSLLPGTTPILSSAKSNAAIAAAVAACSEYGDGIINEPRRCNFNARSLICPAEGTPPANCLTPEEADAINSIWFGPINPEGYRLWGGPAIGTSFGTVLPGGSNAFGFMYDYERYWAHQDPNWPWQSLAGADFATKFTEEMRFQDLKFQATASTDSTNLDKAKNHGTKIIHYHGLTDTLIIPFGSWNYASRLLDSYGVAGAQSFTRSFFLPNQGHCGTAGIAFFDALVNWVENGVAPDSFNVNLGTTASPKPHIVCKYPDEAVRDVNGNLSCKVNGTEPADLKAYSNLGPIVACKNVTVSASPDVCSAPTASVNNLSSDRYGDPITLVQDKNGPFNFGSTLVTLTGTDSRDAVDSCQANVNVVDTTAPSISSVTASPNVLWPANHKMVPVELGVTVFDACDANVVNRCRIVSVTSNEPVNGIGDGNTALDYLITGNLTLNLRAERSGNGEGRTYTIGVVCADVSGNSSTNTVAVMVPHDKSK
jgi:hypothetical protein